MCMALESDTSSFEDFFVILGISLSIFGSEDALSELLSPILFYWQSDSDMSFLKANVSMLLLYLDNLINFVFNIVNPQIVEVDYGCRVHTFSTG